MGIYVKLDKSEKKDVLFVFVESGCSKYTYTYVVHCKLFKVASTCLYQFSDTCN